MIETAYFDNNGNNIPVSIPTSALSKYGNIFNPYKPGEQLKAILRRKQAEHDGPTFVAALEAEEAAAAIVLAARIANETRASREAAEARLALMAHEADAAREARQAYYLNLPPPPPLDAEFNTGAFAWCLRDSTTGVILQFRAETPELLQQILESPRVKARTVRLHTVDAAIKAKDKKPKPVKLLGRELDADHSLFLAGELDADVYVERLFYFLEHENSHEDVLGFVTLFGDILADGTFCPESQKFSLFLKKSFKNYKEDNATAQKTDALPSDDFAAPGDAEDSAKAPKLSDIEGDDRLAGIKQAATKEAAEKVYADWDAIPKEARLGTLAEDRLHHLVKKIAKAKSGKYLYSCDEVAKDADDYSQEIAIIVWKKLATFKGEAKSFYPWLHKICHRAACDAYKETKKINKQHEPLMVEVENENGKVELVDNPGIRGNVVYKRGGKLVFQESRPHFLHELPSFIQGRDLQICGYILEGYSYARIGPLVGLTEAGVESAVRRINAKVAKTKDQEAM